MNSGLSSRPLLPKPLQAMFKPRILILIGFGQCHRFGRLLSFPSFPSFFASSFLSLQFCPNGQFASLAFFLTMNRTGSSIKFTRVPIFASRTSTFAALQQSQKVSQSFILVRAIFWFKSRKSQCHVVQVSAPLALEISSNISRLPVAQMLVSTNNNNNLLSVIRNSSSQKTSLSRTIILSTHCHTYPRLSMNPYWHLSGLQSLEDQEPHVRS
jgi:hypothetical protein